MKHVKLFEQFVQETEENIDLHQDIESVSAETVSDPEASDDNISEEEFKALVTKLVTHELSEQSTEEKEAEELAEGGLTNEELEKVNAYITTNWAPSEAAAEETSTEEETVEPEVVTENENVEKVDEIFGLSSKEQFMKHYKEFTKTWMAKGVPAPNEAEIMKAAEADKFEGKLKIEGKAGDFKNAKFKYVPAKELKWKSDFTSGGTGGKTAAGGV